VRRLVSGHPGDVESRPGDDGEGLALGAREDGGSFGLRRGEPIGALSRGQRVLQANTLVEGRRSSRPLGPLAAGDSHGDGLLEATPLARGGGEEPFHRRPLVGAGRPLIRRCVDGRDTHVSTVRWAHVAWLNDR
jgi:hypothetical protein